MGEKQNHHHNNSAIQSWHPVLLRLFDKRFKSKEELEQFLSWNLSDLPKLDNLKDLEKASRRVIQAMEQGERIGIYGDYDVDGTTACALLYHFFTSKEIGLVCELFQPDRFGEGYGLHCSSIDKAIDKGVHLLITVDCGITNHDAAKYALTRGLDLIITDHHTDAEEAKGSVGALPAAIAVVNPCRRDEDGNSPLRVLAGVGVAFVLCLRIKKDLEELYGKKLPSIYPLLPWVAIGQLCDLVRLTPLNLRLIRHGLKQLKDGSVFVGLRPFFSDSEEFACGPLVSGDKIVFDVGPLLNSPGRLSHASEALKMLVTQSDAEAMYCYQHLLASNKKRKDLQQQVFEEARKQALNDLEREKKLGIHVVYAPHWHQGVLGIVANKLVETFAIPAIVLTNSEESGVIKGSVRSAGGLNIYSILKSISHHFTKFGGHPAAAGLSMPKANFQKFYADLKDIFSKIPPEEFTNTLDYYDVDVDFNEINLALLTQMQYLGPWGIGNERPIFKMASVKLQHFSHLRGGHVRWEFTRLGEKRSPYTNKLQGISFSYLGKWNTTSPEELLAKQNDDHGVIVYFTLKKNTWNRQEFVQLLVDRIVLPH
ncbi:MAG: single-stranded-DNA-specific exonuclease RecJ [Oligoflexia bacterium]|nr:single-stranded-DNA-specific exonuclease RecJ [Oligoflexia bacterium]MBF0366420.1 single-stranded-DNA-specific exonuclease RecJ [Oligoflexia bacterium]